MAWPDQPSFDSGAPFALWYQVPGPNGAGDWRVCATQGLSAVKQLQRVIHDREGSSVTFGGTTTDVGPIDGVPGLGVLVGTGAVAAGAGVDTAQLESVRQDILANNRAATAGRPGARVSLETARIMLWVAFGIAAGVPFEQLVLQRDAVRPTFNVAPLDDAANAGQLTCWDPNAQPPPAARGAIAAAPAGTLAVAPAPVWPWVAGAVALAAAGAGIYYVVLPRYERKKSRERLQHRYEVAKAHQRGRRYEREHPYVARTRE